MVKKNFINIGVLGGSFDPPHKGHLYITKKSLKIFKLKKVIWAITKKNPLKKKPFFSFELRKKLCRKILKGHNLLNFHKWKRYKDLLKMSKLVVFARKGFDTKAKKSAIIKRLKTKNIKFLNNKKMNISSTQLRNIIINGSKKN